MREQIEETLKNSREMVNTRIEEIRRMSEEYFGKAREEGEKLIANAKEQQAALQVKTQELFSKAKDEFESRNAPLAERVRGLGDEAKVRVRTAREEAVKLAEGITKNLKKDN